MAKHESKDNESKDNEPKEEELTAEQKAIAKLPPGSVVPHSGAAQSQELADRGIYQPADQAANRPQTVQESTASKEDKDLHEEHRKNLAGLPPVPAERAGAASQAK